MHLLPERRQRLRIVTLKNAAWVILGSVVLFIAFSAWNELRPRDPSREQLSERGRAVAPPAAAREPVQVIEERPVSDRTPISDRTFTVRDVGSPLAPSTPPAKPVAAPERPRRLTLKESRQRGERVVISGGAEGVRVDATPAPVTKTEPPVLPPDPSITP